MNKIIFSIIFSTFFVALTASDIFACSCLSESAPIEKQVKDAYTKSSAVFVGQVLEVAKKPDGFSVTVRFRIEKSWDKNFQKEITITTGINSAMCGYEFQTGKKYLVYANGADNRLSTNICTRTASAKANKDVALLNKLKKPKITSSLK